MPDRKKVVALTSLGAAAALILAGCSAVNDDKDVTYCVDKNDKVVSQQTCDDDTARGGGGYYFLRGPYGTNYRPGDTIDPTKSNIGRISTGDQTGRSNAGLPSTGKVTTGKSGGFGTGSGKSGGFGGGGSHGFGG
jgi:hypothetical protein